MRARLARETCFWSERIIGVLGLSGFSVVGWLVRVLGAQMNSSVCCQSSNRAPGASAKAEQQSDLGL